MKEGKLVVNPKYRSRQVFCRVLDAVSEILLLLSIAFAGQAALLAEHALGQLAGQVLLLGILGMVFGAALGRVSKTVGAGLCAQVEEELQNTAYRQILEGDWQLVSRMHQGEAEQRIQRDSGITAQAVTEMRRRLGKFLVGMVSMPVFLLFYDRTGAAVLAAALAFSFLLFGELYRLYLQAAARLREWENQTAAFYRDSVEKLSVIQNYQAGDCFERRQAELLRRQKRHRLRVRQYQDGIESGLLFLGILASAGFLTRAWEWRPETGRLEGAVVYLLLAFFLMGNLLPLKRLLGEMAPAMVSAACLAETLELPEEERLDEEWIELLEMRRQEGFAVRFSQVDFGYRKEKPVLEQAVLEALPEEWVGIGGFSGAGKTTAVRLLLGQVLPDSGLVELIHKQGLTCLVSAASREFFAWVPQENSLFPGTIAANLRLGRPDAREEEMWQALGIACLDAFVHRQPEGLHTLVGGPDSCLSAGQAQQLAIARAVLRDAPVCVLDEPTAAMDAETEENVLANLRQVWREKTCILTSHDSRVLAWCDRNYWIAGREIRPVKQVLEETAAAQTWEDVEEPHLPEFFQCGH